MFAVMTTEELNRHNTTLLIFSVLFIFGTVTLGKMYLASGLLYAQILNMLLRPGLSKIPDHFDFWFLFFMFFFYPKKNSTLLSIRSVSKKLVIVAFNSPSEFTFPHNTFHFLYFILSCSFFAALHLRPIFQRKTINSFSFWIRCSYSCFLRCRKFVFRKRCLCTFIFNGNGTKCV